MLTRTGRQSDPMWMDFQSRKKKKKSGIKDKTQEVWKGCKALSQYEKKKSALKSLLRNTVFQM